jgi:ABC-type transport system substrate-binding protein
MQALLEPLLLGGSTDNRTAVDDRSLNELLTAARAEDMGQEREGLYQSAEQRALRLMPLVPLAWFRTHLAVQPRVTGFALTPLGRFDVAKLAPKN